MKEREKWYVPHGLPVDFSVPGFYGPPTLWQRVKVFFGYGKLVDSPILWLKDAGLESGDEWQIVRSWPE